MLMEQYLFPFGCVPQGSRIIIYGAGVVGQCYMQQVRETGYCDVLALADRAWYDYDIPDVKVIAPEDIVKFPYELVVIALRDKKSMIDVSKYLTAELSVPAEYVLAKRSWIEMMHYHPCKREEGWSKRDLAYKQEGLSLAFYMNGGLGDIIMGKKTICSILSLSKVKCRVDIYGNQSFILAVFGTPNWLNNIYPASAYWLNYLHYDLAINTMALMQINNLCKMRLRSYSPRLCEAMLNLNAQLKAYGLADQSMAACYIHFARCRYLGRNAYTAYSNPDAIEVSDTKVEIPLQSKFNQMFENLGLSTYFTVHYGCGELPPGTTQHVKLWPAQYFECLIEMLHEEWPKLNVIQVGGEKEQRLHGADKYFMGEDIELIKYVLRGSELHIDCESGIVHLATQLGTKCVVLFGPTPIWFFGYQQNINITANKCNSCYYVYENFSICPRGMSRPECMYSLTPETVFNYIKKYIKHCRRTFN